MILITTKTWQDNDIKVIPVDKIKWLNEKNIEKKKKVRSFKCNNDNSKILRR